MEGDIRRKKIMELLQTGNQPVTGTDLAKKFAVSRQVIVQDIALLRAVNKNILATNKGYILFEQETKKVKRSFLVQHATEQIKEELMTIVECGGKVLDVVVEHEIYGQITVDLIIASKEDVLEFCRKLENNKTRPLNELTGGIHLHTVEADSEGQLEYIKSKLSEKGFLINR